jgi:hypothetical protein
MPRRRLTPQRLTRQRLTPQRRLGTSVAACLGGAALTLYGATRVWSVQVTERPGLTALRASTTGAARAPWLIGLALVALAGAGALLATRGLTRRLLGVLLSVTGLGVLLAAITVRAGLDPGAAGSGATVWPIACGIGGVLISGAGLAAAIHGHTMPTMSARYERTTALSPSAPPAAASAPGAPPGLSPSPDQQRATTAADNRAAWDALDRGDDPTLR